MQYLLEFVDKNMLEILIISGTLIGLVYLIRSFRRNLLIARGQARFVLERYDTGTEKLHRWITFFVLFLLLPLMGYVKFVNV